MYSQNSLFSQLDQITSISLLEDLQSQDNKTKINAIHNLTNISLALGCEATRKELLPYLKNCINNEEEDEILIELAKILSNFLTCIGGIKYINELLNIFEVILSIDEPGIRKEAINSLKNILNQIGNIKDIEKELMNLINKFYSSDDVNQKLSALNIIILVYQNLEESNKKIVINFLENFSNSNNLSIRKELISELIKITKYLNIDIIKKFIETLIKDENENIKVDIINLIISLKDHKDLLQIIDYIYDLIQKLSEDLNLKVRLSLINSLPEILQFPKITYNFKQLVLNIYIKFCKSLLKLISFINNFVISSKLRQQAFLI